MMNRFLLGLLFAVSACTPGDVGPTPDNPPPTDPAASSAARQRIETIAAGSQSPHSISNRILLLRNDTRSP